MLTILAKADLLDVLAPPRPRSFLRFACEDVRIVTGPRAGELYDPAYMPFHAKILLLFDDPWWYEFWLAGGVQGGKTLASCVVPVLCHLFDRCEDVIFGAPTEDLAYAVWEDKVLPSILASRYASLLPRAGAGSRGGRATELRLRHGPTVRFLGAGGGDVSVISHTAPVVALTEVDRMDVGGSRDTDPVRRFRARTHAFPPWRRRLYADCTVTVEHGAVWQNAVVRGSDHRAASPCPRCGEWIVPERSLLVWDLEAADEVALAESAGLRCSACAVTWSDADRVAAIGRSLLVARGQRVEGGEVVGARPRTRRCGVRWTGVHSPARTLGEAAQLEDEVRRRPTVEKEREAAQHFWAELPRLDEEAALGEDELLRAVGLVDRGPPGEEAAAVTLGVDVHLRHLDWVCVAWNVTPAGTAVDWGVVPVRHDGAPTPADVRRELDALREMLLSWDRGPDLAAVDAGWEMAEVVAFVKAAGLGWVASKGFASKDLPWQPSKRVVYGSKRGDGWRLTRTRRGKLLEVDVDRWKGVVQRALRRPAGAPGALALPRATPSALRQLAAHLTAERQVTGWTRRGPVTRWVQERPDNHLLDALVLACAAADVLGVRPASKAREEA